MALYRVKDWNTHFENHKTRILKRLDWVPIPNKMDGDGYTELVDHPDGASYFGVWCAILEIASKCSPRGDLARSDGTPHDSASLSRVSRLPSAAFPPAIAILLKIGWLEEYGGDPALSGVDLAFNGHTKGREEKGMEGKRREEKARFPPNLPNTSEAICVPETSCSLISLASWELDETYIQFAALSKQFWPRILNEEIAGGYRWYWTKFSIPEKLTAINNIKLRIQANEDGEYVKHMPDYLKSEWKRGPKPPLARAEDVNDKRRDEMVKIMKITGNL